MTANTDKNNYIIKLYLLDDQNVWKDAGKGYLHIQKLWNSQTEIEEDTIEILLSQFGFHYFRSSFYNYI